MLVFCFSWMPSLFQHSECKDNKKILRFITNSPFIYKKSVFFDEYVFCVGEYYE